MRRRVMTFPARPGNEVWELPSLEHMFRLVSVQCQFVTHNNAPHSTMPLLRVEHGKVCKLYDLPASQLIEGQNMEVSWVLDSAFINVDVGSQGTGQFHTVRMPDFPLLPSDNVTLRLFLGEPDDLFGIVTVAFDDYGSN